MHEIYTDGSCCRFNKTDKQGPSGWAFCVVPRNDGVDERISDERIWIVSGGIELATNNIAELMAVIHAISFFKDTHETFKIYTDSTWVINCAQKIWKRNVHPDLWAKYDKITENRTVEFVWVKGHSENKYNDIADKYACKESQKIKDSLKLK